MLAGTGVAVFAMMLLGWSREIAGLFGMGNGGAIACAVFSIYLIDFSINAVMSTDRALIVDTLPPQQQEAGNAWAGRMSGIGGVAGFFVYVDPSLIKGQANVQRKRRPHPHPPLAGPDPAPDLELPHLHAPCTCTHLDILGCHRARLVAR